MVVSLMVIRLLVLLVLVAAIVLFVLQNAAPTLALAFLGLQTPPFPLSWWVVGALVAGGLTTIVLQVWLSVSNFVTGQTGRSRVQSKQERNEPDFSRGNSATRTATSRERSDEAWQDWRGYESATPPATQRTTEPQDRRSAVRDSDDWERPLSDDWDEDPPTDAPRSTTDRLTETDLRDFEAKQAPARTSQSGSVYSYSYREPGTGAGKPEPVVDAEYRVLVPPPGPSPGALEEPPPAAVENADDWFEDSDDQPNRRGADRTG